jgi:predicted DNA-binding transcriptional regulator YafY
MLLQTKGRMTAQELADKLEVSTRTVYRDLDALSISGVPVYADRGPNGGCFLMESYRTNLTGLTEKEVQALFMFTVPGLLADLGADKTSEAAILKLTAALPSPFQHSPEWVRQRIHLDTAPWFHPAEPVPFLSTIQEAIWQAHRVRLVYRRGDGQWVKRLMEPYGLVAKAGIWYVVGAVGRGTQVYRVSRVQEAILSSSQFERPKSFDLAAYWAEWCANFEQTQAKYPVRLRVTPAGIPLMIQAFGEGMHTLLTETAELTDHNCLLLTMNFESAKTACQQLLGLGTAVEVLEPPSLRLQMHDMALQVATFYR